MPRPSKRYPKVLEAVHQILTILYKLPEGEAGTVFGIVLALTGYSLKSEKEETK